MSTRSVVAIPTGDGWKGRYAHSDGYPSHQLVALHTLVNRDGVEAVIQKLLHDRYGWSFIDPDEPALDEVVADPNADYGTAEHRASMFAKGGMYGDGRFATEEGYGTAYTEVDGQSNPNEWVTHYGGDWGTEWCYILYPTYITVLKRVDAQGKGAVGFFGLPAAEEGGWEVYGTVRYDEELTDEIVGRVECGADLEHCGHVASYHFPEASETHYDTDQWLGRDTDVRFHLATHVVVDGEHQKLSGSGGRYYADHTYPDRWNSVPDARRPEYWFASLQGGAEDLRIGRYTREGMKLEIDIVLPPTSVRGELVVPTGTVLER